jgi:hypothetical protein
MCPGISINNTLQLENSSSRKGFLKQHLCIVRHIGFIIAVVKTAIIFDNCNCELASSGRNNGD